MRFHTDQAVVYIGNPCRKPESIEKFPEPNKVYHVRNIEYRDGRIFIRLKELINPHVHYNEGMGEVQFEETMFAPYNPPKIEISESLLQQCEQLISIKEVIVRTQKQKS